MSYDSKQVNYTMKLMYVIGILFVIMGHVNNGGVSLLFDWFPPYSFHLALFVFCSGYFYKKDNDGSFFSFVKKKFVKLIIPLYVWNLIYGLFVLITHHFGFKIGGSFTLYNLTIMPIISGQKFMYNLGGWFLVPLFLVQVFYLLLRIVLKFKKKKELILLAICFISGFIGVHYASIGYNQGWWLVLSRMLFFIPFYAGGYFYKNILEAHDNIPNLLYFGIILVIHFIIVIALGRYPTYRPSLCDNFVDGVFMPFVVGFLGIFFWLRICKILEPIVRNNKTIDLIADHTFDIMMHHFFGFFVVKLFYAFCFKFFNWFPDYSIKSLKTVFVYYYIPNHNSNFYLIYVIIGLVVPLVIVKIIEALKKHFFIRRKKESVYESI